MRAFLRNACTTALAPLAAASAQQLATPQPGHVEERPAQAVQAAPPGYVGRKTTDVTRRAGTAEAGTAGNHAEHVLVVGGFAKKCPAYVDGFGIVDGNFEYSLRYDEVIVTGGVAREYHHSRSLTARLTGRVGDDARLIDVDVDGEFMSDVNGERTTSPIRRRFTPGPVGEPDWAAMRDVVAASADVATATVVLMGGTIYKEAEQAWRDPHNKCAEVKFDPPTETRAPGPDQEEKVRAEVVAREGGAAVPWRTDNINVKGAGRIAPKPAESRPGAPALLTYTASSRPKRGHGFGLAMETAVGIAEGEWTIIDPLQYEGTFSYSDAGTGFTGAGPGQNELKLFGRLTWKPADEDKPSTFGEMKSTLFKPVAGEITVESGFRNEGPGGSHCAGSGKRTFPVAGMSQASLRYLRLEIAEDGRYKLTFVIPDNPEPFPAWDYGTTCVFPNATANDRVQVRGVALVLGLQQGTANAEGAIEGRLATPIRRGPRTIEGSWSFAKVTGNP